MQIAQTSFDLDLSPQQNLPELLRLRARFGNALRPWLIHRRMQLAFDAVSSALAVIIAYQLRWDFLLPQNLRTPMLAWTAVLLFFYPLVMRLTDGYRNTWQFFGLRDFGQLAWRALPIVASLLLARAVLPKGGAMPYSVSLIWFGVALAGSSALRIARRIDHEAVQRAARGTRRTLLMGTESSLAAAIRQISTFGGSHLVGLVAEDLHRMKISGVQVLGAPADLAKLIIEHRIEAVFASTSDLTSLAEVNQLCSDLAVDFKLLPSLKDVTDNHVRVIRNVTPINARKGLSHEPVEINPAVISCLTGQVVLVTGAGGSIGSELARQVSSLDVKRLLILDQDENSIFDLMNEIGTRGSVKPLIADVRQRDIIRSVFRENSIDVVFHAAAYKHVPLMEHNPCEAVITNVGGTLEVAQAAVDAGCKRFVMISTDKAVRPSSIMGASKRLAEMVVQQCSTSGSYTNEKTQFACVRFGNVLGSRGSVLPTFLKQIAAGGPITVTNADMTRYFMTIPQAVRLVLQAATLASCGDIYMLDMGDPVRIIEFAREVIRSSGLRVDQDIKIQVTGARPGEKLHEQLWNDDAKVSSTSFPMVFRVHAPPSVLGFGSMLNSLIRAARYRQTDDVKALLRDMPIDYRPERAHTDHVVKLA